MLTFKAKRNEKKKLFYVVRAQIGNRQYGIRGTAWELAGIQRLFTARVDWDGSCIR